VTTAAGPVSARLKALLAAIHTQRAYLLVGVPLVLVMGVVAARGGWLADFFLHVAVVDELARFPVHPPHPFVVADYPSFYYTPYSLALGVLSRLTCLSAATVLAAAGVFNLTLLLIGFWLFMRTFSRKPAAAAIGLVLVLLLWGPHPWQWSGFINLAGLPLILPYPSTFATALMFLSWVLLLNAIALPRPAPIVGIAVMAWLIVLSHPYTMANTVLGMIAILVAERRSVPRRLIAGFGAAGLAAALLAVAWPYFPILQVPVSADSPDAIHLPLFLDLPSHVALVAVGLPALWWRWRRKRTDVLVVLFLLGIVPLIIGGITGHYAMGRFWPVVVLPLQVATALEVSNFLQTPRQTRTVIYATVVALAVIVGLRGGAGGLPPGAISPELREALYIAEPTSLPMVTGCVKTDEVVATNNQTALRMLPGLGAKVVAPGYPDAFIPDETQRERDQDALFDPATQPAQVAEIVARDQIRWVLWDMTGPLADPQDYRRARPLFDRYALLAPISLSARGDC
jgi:hypothetical protein